MTPTLGRRGSPTTPTEALSYGLCQKSNSSVWPATDEQTRPFGSFTQRAGQTIWLAQ